jgi:hypothetical protein
VLPQVMSFIAIVIFAISSNKALLPKYVILIISYYTTLFDSIGFYLKRAAESAISASVSFKRIQVNNNFKEFPIL